MFMNTPQKMNWVATPRTCATKPATDWRDRAVVYVKWVTAGVVGLLFGSFVSCYWDLPVWGSIVFGVAIALAAYWFIGWVEKQIS
jgi:hypothetical protein